MGRSKRFCRLIAAAVVVVAVCFGAVSRAESRPVSSTGIPTVIVVDVAPYPNWQASLAAQTAPQATPSGPGHDAVILTYAARELATHLARIGTAPKVWTRGVPPGSAITLIIRPSQRPAGTGWLESVSASQAHRITRDARGVTISASTGIGVLYGVYSFLEQLGFDWPDVATAIAPSPAHAAAAFAQIQDLHWFPAQAYRGFWVYEPSKTDAAFLVWMARKKFNIGPSSLPGTRAFLGIRAWGGGHHLIEQVFSEPGLFDRHPDFFARIGWRLRPVAADYSAFNPAFSSREAAWYFADKIVARLEHGDLRAFDILNIWQVDAFGRAFDERWTAWWNGNASDNLLIFYANVVDRLAEHRAAGRLTRDVVIAGASYRQTMIPPRYPANARRLEGKAYLHLFYPFERDWTPFAGAEASATNRRILDQIESWKASARLGFGVVDYQNMSRYGGLALDDHRDFASNLSTLSRGGLALSAYMHVSHGDPGPRRLLHALASRAGWTATGQENLTEIGVKVTAGYFQDRFGSDADRWRAIYALVGRATSNASEMFGIDSLHLLLIQCLAWAEPVYGAADVRKMVAGFKRGGREMRPGRFYAKRDYAAAFIGLDDSIRLLSTAVANGRATLAGTRNAESARHARADLDWIEATLERYRAIDALARYTVTAPRSNLRGAARADLVATLAVLDKRPQLESTLSPVNQKEFINEYRKLAGL